MRCLMSPVTGLFSKSVQCEVNVYVSTHSCMHVRPHKNPKSDLKAFLETLNAAEGCGDWAKNCHLKTSSSSPVCWSDLSTASYENSRHKKSLLGPFFVVSNMIINL